MSHDIFLTKNHFEIRTPRHTSSQLQFFTHDSTRAETFFIYKNVQVENFKRRRDLILPRGTFSKKKILPLFSCLERVKTPIRFDSIVVRSPPTLSKFTRRQRRRSSSRENAEHRETSIGQLFTKRLHEANNAISPLSLWVRLDRFESCSRTLKHTSAVDSGVIKSPGASGPSLGSNFAAAECPTRWIVAPEVPALFPALEL